MTNLFLYILASSHDPDNIECPVPYLVNDTTIFFGPCKKLLREWLYSNYLTKSDDYSFADHEDIFVVGANGSNPQRKRKIVWAGRITRVMTFEIAYNERESLGFQKMLQEHLSPLHVQPIYNNAFIGYKHISSLHESCWVSDLTRNKVARLTSQVHMDKGNILLKQGIDRHQVFTRDCCFLCENIFFAHEAGIQITEKMLDLLKQVQRDKEKEIDDYAIFGKQKNGNAEGLRGDTWKCATRSL